MDLQARDGIQRIWQSIGSHWHTFVGLCQSLEAVSLVLRTLISISRRSHLLVPQDPSAPMGMKEHTFTGLAVVGLVNAYRY
jgi:hypothetical protein